MSLNTKVFIFTILLMLGIGGTVLAAGFFLYANGVVQQYFVTTWNLANAEAAVVEQDGYREKSDEILEIYDSIPESERGDGTSEEYKAHFTKTIDDQFRELQQGMRDLQDRNGPMNAFIVAIDSDYSKMIYICDCDPELETFCYPGSWENYEEGTLKKLVEGRKLTRLEAKQGITRRVQAIITNQPKYGVRCTAAATLYETDRYTVMMCVDEKMEPIIEISKVFLTQYLSLLAFVTLLAAWISMFVIRRLIVKRINKMERAARAYSQKTPDDDSTEKYFDKLDIHTGDEIEDLALTLQKMEDEIGDYVDDLTTVTAERERMHTELSVGSQIQNSMLPQHFPAFSDRDDFEIYASMDPAKEVGGDFYDFIMIDDDHIVLVIADVAGKGIPAALFMMASKISIASRVEEYADPAEILEIVNNKVCAYNLEGMFVTVWLGVLELSTGKLTTANAGHEYPVKIHADGHVEMIRDPHGFVLGGMEDIKYKDFEIQLEPGDRIFVYTDGVTEATAKGNVLFGNDRLIEALAKTRDADPRQTIISVIADIDDFVGEEEQFDDLTMLCIKYNGPQS